MTPGESNSDRGTRPIKIDAVCLRTLIASATLALAFVFGVESARGFDRVINLNASSPPLGGSVFPNTQVNVYTGGVIRSGFNAGFFGDGMGVEVNVFSGTVGNEFTAGSGSKINVSGGVIGDDFTTSNSSVVKITGGVFGDNAFNSGNGSLNITGGTFGDGFYSSVASSRIAGGVYGRDFTLVGEAPRLVGGEFHLNGVPLLGDNPAMAPDDVFAGVFADGSVFIFSRHYDGGFGFNTRVENVSLPVANLTPITVNQANAPRGLRPGQTLNLVDGGSLSDDFAAVGATLNISAGDVGKGLEIADTHLAMTGGTIGNSFAAYHGSVLDIGGGLIGSRFNAHSGSVVNISGGVVESLTAHAGSTLHLTGGKIGGGLAAQASSVVNITGGVTSWLDAAAGSTVNISGGAIGGSLRAVAGSQVTLTGGEFLINGVAPAASTITLAESDTLTGTLEDGSVFIFRIGPDSQGAIIQGVQLASGTLPTLDTTPMTVDATHSVAGLRRGQTVTVVEGGALSENFGAIGGTLHVAGGSVGAGLKAIDSQVTVTGGQVLGGTFDRSTVELSQGILGLISLQNQSVAHISGGSASVTVGNDSTAYITGGSVGFVAGGFAGDSTNARVVMSGGVAPLTSYANAGSIVTITGGSIGSLDADAGSVVNLSGGEIDNLDTFLGSIVNISGGSLGFAPNFSGTVNVSGGVVGPSADAFSSSVVNITGGEVAAGFNAKSGSTIAISGGLIGTDFDAESGCKVTITGGTIGSAFDANSGSKVTISGGNIGDGFRALSGSNVLIDGGFMGKSFRALTGSSVKLSGGDFLLNGAPPGGASVTLQPTDVLSGVLADGTVVIFAGLAGDQLNSVQLVPTTLPPVDLQPILVDSQNAPRGLRSGQVATLVDGGGLARQLRRGGCDAARGRRRGRRRPGRARCRDSRLRRRSDRRRR